MHGRLAGNWRALDSGAVWAFSIMCGIVALMTHYVQARHVMAHGAVIPALLRDVAAARNWGPHRVPCGHLQVATLALLAAVLRWVRGGMVVKACLSYRLAQIVASRSPINTKRQAPLRELACLLVV